MSTQEEMEQKNYSDLFYWLNNTMVEMEEDYVNGVQRKPIRNLFGYLKYSYKDLIQRLFEFILGVPSEITPEERRGLETRDFTDGEHRGLIQLGDDINAVFDVMKRTYQEMPRDDEGKSNAESDAFKKFIKNEWNPTINRLKREYSRNDFVTHLLERYRFMNEPVFFQPKHVRNLQTLFATIVKMPRPLLIQLRETFNDTQYYNTWYGPKLESEGGGRKLSRRRKTNPKSKSKSKHKHKRRSYKKRL